MYFFNATAVIQIAPVIRNLQLDLEVLELARRCFAHPSGCSSQRDGSDRILRGPNSLSGSRRAVI